MELLKRINIPSSILVALVPIIGYVAAYFYQFGYYSVFGVPEYLISANIENAIKSTSLLILVGVVIGGFIFLVNKMPESKNKDEKKTKSTSIAETNIVFVIFVLLIGWLSFSIQGVSFSLKIIIPVIFTIFLLSLVYL